MTISLAVVPSILALADPDEDGDESIDETTPPEKLILLDGSVWAPKPASRAPWHYGLDKRVRNAWREWLAVPFAAALPLAT